MINNVVYDHIKNICNIDDIDNFLLEYNEDEYNKIDILLKKTKYTKERIYYKQEIKKYNRYTFKIESNPKCECLGFYTEIGLKIKK